MSNPNQSSNKLPREIYQRRRIAAFVVILVVVVGLLIAFTAFGGNNEDETAAPESAPISAPENPEDEGASSEGSEEIESDEPAASDEAEANREDSNEGSEEPKASEEAQSSNTDPALADKDSCELSDLVIRASSDDTTYPNGVQPTFGMTVVNPTGADCEIDLDEDTLRFEVYRLTDNKRMWSDTDCYVSVQNGT